MSFNTYLPILTNLSLFFSHFAPINPGTLHLSVPLHLPLPLFPKPWHEQERSHQTPGKETHGEEKESVCSLSSPVIDSDPVWWLCIDSALSETLPSDPAIDSLHSPPQTHNTRPDPARAKTTHSHTHRHTHTPVCTVLQIDNLAVSCETWSMCCITIILPGCLSPLPGRVTWPPCPADWCVWVRVWRLGYQGCGEKSSCAGINRSQQQQQHYSDPSPEPY